MFTRNGTERSNRQVTSQVTAQMGRSATLSRLVNFSKVSNITVSEGPSRYKVKLGNKVPYLHFFGGTATPKHLNGNCLAK